MVPARYAGQDEKGIRWKSGTVLAAVSPLLREKLFIALFATGLDWEGAINGTSQKTCLNDDLHPRVTGRSHTR